MANPISDFVDAMKARGISPIEPIADKLASGNLIRFRAEGDKPGRRNGWAQLHLDGAPAGAFGHHRLNVSEKWRSGSALAALTSAERRAITVQARERAKRRMAEICARQEGAAGVALNLWRDAGRPDPAHGYLTSKDISPFGIRQSGDELLVPMVDSAFRLWNVQRIFPNGRKRFLPGGRTEGLFWPHGAHFENGHRSPGPLVVGEGFATMAAIHIATGLGVIAAMSARNLESVARAMRTRFPDRAMIIAADDDRHLKENIGLIAARKAAEVVNGPIAMPLPLVNAEPRSADRGVDFADIPHPEIAARIAEAWRATHE